MFDYACKILRLTFSCFADCATELEISGGRPEATNAIKICLRQARYWAGGRSNRLQTAPCGASAAAHEAEPSTEAGPSGEATQSSSESPSASPSSLNH